MDDQFATQSLGARMVSIAQMAVAIHASMDLLLRQLSERTLRQSALIGGADRFVTDDTQPYAAGEMED